MREQVGRRSFLAALATLIGGAWSLGAAALAGTFISSTLKLRKVEAEAILGDLTIYGEKFRAVRLRIPVDDGWYRRVQQKIFYIRADESDPSRPIVLSAKCSHLGCTVAWDEEREEFRCPCHGGRFASDGSVLGGPPPAPLERIEAELRGGDVYVKLT